MDRNPILCAIDTPELARAQALIAATAGAVGGVKLGLEFFAAHGPDGIRKAAGGQKNVFLDLKLHDIPETVARAVASAARIEAELLTVHTSGGYEMMSRAAEASRGRVKLLGVTVLTSLAEDDLRAEGIGQSIPEMVKARARIAARAGLSGLVCSPHEIAAARAAAHGLLTVVPGIRPGGPRAADDQKRVATAGQAAADGADYLVVGRPLRDAAEPAEAFEALVREIEAAG
jgi:orotidine-5'-phosphate decarboxylase